MLTRIDFCGTTGHDHGGWQVAAAVGRSSSRRVTKTPAVAAEET